MSAELTCRQLSTAHEDQETVQLPDVAFSSHVDARPVLVVEDDADSRLMLRTWLSLLGVAVATAKNGADALKEARRISPCLILLDFMMPVMGGREFRLLQCSDPKLCAVPVVLTSAHPDARDIAGELRMDGVIEKPVSFEEIERVVAKFCM
jgi:CheY-like chemotaxis protein